MTLGDGIALSTLFLSIFGVITALIVKRQPRRSHAMSNEVGESLKVLLVSMNEMLSKTNENMVMLNTKTDTMSRLVGKTWDKVNQMEKS